jgi:hypothetical protein
MNLRNPDGLQGDRASFSPNHLRADNAETFVFGSTAFRIYGRVVRDENGDPQIIGLGPSAESTGPEIRPFNDNFDFSSDSIWSSIYNNTFGAVSLWLSGSRDGRRFDLRFEENSDAPGRITSPVTVDRLDAFVREQPPRCFLAGTPILMADGQEKPIEDIRVGDMVMSFDPSADQGRGALVPKPVSRTFQNITRSIIDLRGLHMTPGHVCLTDDGRFETIAEILLRDGILVEADGTPIRARTGAKIGSMEDIPVLIAYPDEKTGKEIFIRARAGIPCCLVRERDGTMCHRSLALMLRAYHQTLTPDGLILSPDGSLGEATDWPEDSTPMDEDYRRNWVIQTADGKPYVPEWILEVASEAREEQTVGATLQRIISPPSQRFTPKVVNNPTPPARNRAERRAQKHRGPK